VSFPLERIGVKTGVSFGDCYAEVVCVRLIPRIDKIYLVILRRSMLSPTFGEFR
jgi:hypothetical protein